jgi:hypothetical protein
MERLLLLWDELDDLSGVGRHFVICAASALGAIPATLVGGAAALAIWVVAPQLHVNAAFLGLTAAFWGSHRSSQRPTR